MKNRNRFTVLLALMLVLAMLTGCGSSSSYAKSEAAMPYPAETMSAVMEDAWAEEAPAAPSPSNSNAGSTLPQNRKWVITMNISTETEDLDAALDAISRKITQLGGYVENQEIQNGSSYSSRRSRSAYMTVRIPADQVDAFQAGVGECSNVTSSSRTVRDITLSYTDTESRIAALRAEETRLLELMAQAADMSDLLEIESRLTDVRYELESYTSQLRRYDNQVDYATISLDVSEVKQYTPVAKLTFWQRITKGLADNMDDLAESIVDSIVWLVVSLPYLVVMALVGWILFVVGRRWKRRSDAKRAARLQQQYALYQQQMQQEQQTEEAQKQEE